ncbi:HalD/BesD family halogenase [Streptomyces aidingensis]|uniref:Fe2OG dioxygenase domain-containing protein n=1 Tax=Streptomyces aidingensis TaxID=910347 RepID=A0A1I1F6N5_9ACTN|nr:hypothetical protein [Streptomyces aidingensis]SFB95045.1 hypothetical protein SAMN05421773_101628 [Streptomyces aidingensis]
MLSLPYRAGELRALFGRLGYLRLPRLLTDEGLAALRADFHRLEKLTVRSEHRRCLLDGRLIARESPLIDRLYADPDLLSCLCELSGLDAAALPEPDQRHALDVLHERDDAHTPHTDGHPLVLVLFLEAPAAPQDGGLLEYVPPPPAGGGDAGWPAAAGQVLRAHHAPGDAYLLRGDTTLHRVTPLRRSGVRRAVLSFAYAARERQLIGGPSGAAGGSAGRPPGLPSRS